MIKIDLHSHTHHSDGALSPAALLDRAMERGVTHLAITDHDCLHWHDENLRNKINYKLQLIDGIEISTLWNGREIHIVGLFVDPGHAALVALSEKQQALRWQRVELIDQRLQAAGISGLMPWLAKLPCRAVSRSHVADFLIESGQASSREKAFKRLLGPQGRFRAPAQWCSIGEAVQCITGAGGIAVLAHPDSYRMTNTRLQLLINDFRAAGGEAMEVSYANLGADKRVYLAQLCARNALWASAGSDFHDPQRHWTDVGKVVALPAACRDQAIWHHPVWQQRINA